MQPTDTQSAERALEDIDRKRRRLADERHQLLNEWPRPADADARLTRISGEQAELSERADAIHAEFGTT